jgi:hypothetical protein
MKGVDDPTVEQGDIVVNEQRAKQLSQPPRGGVQSKPIAATPARAAPPRSGQPGAAQPAAPAAPAAAQTAPANPSSPAAIAAQAAPANNAAPTDTSQPVKPDPNRTIRAVGPTFIPAR